jgi:hypothetical protein
MQSALAKTGKARAIPISQEMQDEMFTHPAERKTMGAMFTSLYRTIWTRPDG